MNDMEMMSAAKIRDLRRALGMTLKEFAEEVGVSTATAGFWESGRSHPRWQASETLNKIADEVAAGLRQPKTVPMTPVRRGPRFPKVAS